MFPNAYCNELSKLRTEVKPLSFETVSHILEAELNRPIPSVFTEIKEIPGIGFIEFLLAGILIFIVLLRVLFRKK